MKFSSEARGGLMLFFFFMHEDEILERSERTVGLMLFFFFMHEDFNSRAKREDRRSHAQHEDGQRRWPT